MLDQVRSVGMLLALASAGLFVFLCFNGLTPEKGTPAFNLFQWVYIVTSLVGIGWIQWKLYKELSRQEENK